MINLQSIWCEKYRPQVISDLIIDEDNKRIINKIAEEDQTSHLLFVGPPGTGKTSLAKIIVKDILKCQYLYLNASDENGIDTIRSKVTNFAQTKSFDGKIKVIILDEGDGLSASSQQALRNTMETFAENTRFILTANFKHKITSALQSRCQLITLKPSLEQTVKRCLGILRSENVDIAEDQKKKFIDLIRSHFPDIRKCINELQKNVINGELKINHLGIDNTFISKIYDFILEKDSCGCRSFYIENESQFQGDYQSLLKHLLEYIYLKDINTKKEMIAVIANHLYQSVFVLDQEINFFSCLIMLENIKG